MFDIMGVCIEEGPGSCEYVSADLRVSGIADTMEKFSTEKHRQVTSYFLSKLTNEVQYSNVRWQCS